MLKKVSVLLMCCFILSSCSNESAIQQDDPETVDVKKPESITVINANDPPIDYSKGGKTDTKSANNKMTENDIRVDIQDYIDTLSLTPTQKVAIEYDASLFQRVLSVDTKNEVEVKTLSQDMANSLNCITRIFNDMAESMDILSEIEQMTFNTPQKLETYTRYSQIQSETPINLPSGDTCNSL